MTAIESLSRIVRDDRGVAWIEDGSVKVMEVVLDHVASGLSAEEIHEQYPRLSLAQIHAALAFYYDHQAEFAAQMERSASTPAEGQLAERFGALAGTWKRETAVLSMLNRKLLHPAYQRIIGMGPKAVPLILRELQRTRGHWLWALHAITGEDPAKPGATFDEAVDAWLTWGARQGYL